MDRLYAIAGGLNKAFPDGNEPFKIVTRLAEECGELAAEVNHWERTGAKVKKLGEPSKENLAHEIQHVITAALQIALYYGVDKELEASLEASCENLKKEGFLK